MNSAHFCRDVRNTLRVRLERALARFVLFQAQSRSDVKSCSAKAGIRSAARLQCY